MLSGVFFSRTTHDSRFNFQSDSEPPRHGLTNFLSKLEYVGPSAARMVNQNQSLPVMNAHPGIPETLPATLINEPGRRQFDALLLRISHNIGVTFPERFKRCAIHHRVFEETSGVRNDVRIRQLATTDCHHSLRHVQRTKSGFRRISKVFLQIPIPEHKGPRARQSQTDFSDDVTARSLFEQAVAVSEPALRVLENDQLTSLAVQGCNRFKTIAEFDPVSTNILDRSGTRRSGNQCKIFNAAITGTGGI